MEYTYDEILLMQIFCLVFVLLYMLILMFISHNIYRYIYRLRMKQCLIVQFYILIFLGISTRIVEFFVRAFNPVHGFYPEEAAYIQYIDAFALTLAICVELTLILTVHKLTLGLRLTIG